MRAGMQASGNKIALQFVLARGGGDSNANSAVFRDRASKGVAQRNKKPVVSPCV